MANTLTTAELSKYWDIANTLQNQIDAAEYKGIVLPLVFLKYLSDSFDERRKELVKEFSDPKSDSYKADPKRQAEALEERDYYRMVNVFYVPESARWQNIQDNARQADIAIRIDDALFTIEKENPKLDGVVKRTFAQSELPPEVLGVVVDNVAQIDYKQSGRNGADVLGQVYEYFLGKFALAEGKLAGAFYTSPSIVKTLVEVLQPLEGRVYDPACGSGGMFVQSERFVEAHGGKKGQIAIYGQESNAGTRRLCAMNLAIRGIDFDLGKTHADSFSDDQHVDKRFDFILMNPPFQRATTYPRKELTDDPRFKKYGLPRESPAWYAWMSHAVHHLSPKGRAGVVMARGSLNSSQGEDDLVRGRFLDDDIVECIIDLPAKLFFNTQIPSCLWFFNKDKSKWKNDRTGQVLFIDARKMGTPISKSQIEFSDEEIAQIAKTFENWANGGYEDVQGFCASISRSDIAKNGDSLSPGRYIGTEDEESESDEDFVIRMTTLTEQLGEQLTKSHELEAVIRKNLGGLGYEF